jgi:hypothetical protein
MSTLVPAVLERIKKTYPEATEEQVEAILAEAGIQTVSAAGVPVRLRILTMGFSGTKTLSGDPSSGAVPFTFDWTVPPHVSGVSSGANLRGKTSVLLMAQWAMTGRCHLQANVRSWIQKVNVRFQIDSSTIEVALDDTDNTPRGSVNLIEVHDDGERRTELGSFATDAEFEAVMGAVMLQRLRLDVISMWSNTAGTETPHRWPAYVGALTVRADKLDPLIGNEGVLASRLLQMFAGTSWSAPVAQAATALGRFDHASKKAAAAAAQVSEGQAAIRSEVQARVADARTRLESMSDTAPDMDTLLSATAQVNVLSHQAHEVELRLHAAQVAAAQVNDELRAEQQRHQQLMEDAMAQLFFGRMTPTVCPRCSAAVTAERRKKEPEEHACSLCTHDLDLPALESQLVVASSMPESARTSLITASADAAEHRDTPDEGVDVVGPLQALQEAADEANAAVAALEQKHAAAVAARDAATATAQTHTARIDGARTRQQAALDLARAEGALEALTEQPPPIPPGGPSEFTAAVIAAADSIIKQWLKDEQDPRLEAISAEITDLVRSFGADNIDSVRLIGNANMQVRRGGIESGYGQLTQGEKLRLKLATAIAVIKHGYAAGVGRHPGLLFIDSPAAEEIPESDLRTMLSALNDVATATDIQIMIATRYGDVLTEILSPANVIVAKYGDPVW